MDPPNHNFTGIIHVPLSSLSLYRLSIAAVLLQRNEGPPEIPDDIIEEMMNEVIVDLDLTVLGSRRRRQSAGTPLSVQPKKKRQMIRYDRQRAKLAVYSDYFGIAGRILIFRDKSFERTFRIKKYMVDDIIAKLAKYDTFLETTIDRAGRESIDPRVKFLVAMSVICYGVSFSAFQAYYQMGHSTASSCVSELFRGMFHCPEITDTYFRRPTKSAVGRILSLHGREHKLP